jgi:hypothetical protein
VGNATGISSADVISMRVRREFDMPSAYADIIWMAQATQPRPPES